MRRTCVEEAPDAVLVDVPADRARAYEALQLLQAIRADSSARPLLVLTWQLLPQRVGDRTLVLEKPFPVTALREALDALMRATGK
ncbi:MAG TPA: hypothetical protein VEZ14_07255 [Dehalococcoidia bacterium]|nr:hypothetical protein [Dehalococcoidia bacterium]